MAFSHVTATLNPELVIKTDIRELLNTIEDKTGIKPTYKKGKYILDSSYEKFKLCEKIVDAFLSKEESDSSGEDESVDRPGVKSSTHNSLPSVFHTSIPYHRSGQVHATKTEELVNDLELTQRRTGTQWYAGQATGPGYTQHQSYKQTHVGESRELEDAERSSIFHKKDDVVKQKEYRRMFSDSSDSMPPLEQVDDEELEKLQQREMARSMGEEYAQCAGGLLKEYRPNIEKEEIVREQDSEDYSQTIPVKRLPMYTTDQQEAVRPAEKSVHFEFSTETKTQGDSSGPEGTGTKSEEVEFLHADDMYVDADIWEYLTTIHNESISDIEDTYGVICETLTSGENLDFQHVVVKANSEVNVKDGAGAIRQLYDTVSRDCYKNTYSLPWRIRREECRSALSKIKVSYPGLVIKDNVEDGSVLFIGETEVTRKAVEDFKKILNISPRPRRSRSPRTTPFRDYPTERTHERGNGRRRKERDNASDIFRPTSGDALQLQKETKQTEGLLDENEGATAGESATWDPRIKFTDPDDFKNQNPDQSTTDKQVFPEDGKSREQQNDTNKAALTGFLTSQKFQSEHATGSLDQLSSDLQSAIERNETVLKKSRAVSKQTTTLTECKKGVSKNQASNALPEEPEVPPSDLYSEDEHKNADEEPFRSSERAEVRPASSTSMNEERSGMFEQHGVELRRSPDPSRRNIPIDEDVIATGNIDQQRLIPEEIAERKGEVSDDKADEENDEDLQKAINLSLLESGDSASVFTVGGTTKTHKLNDDTDMKRALELSLREFEAEQQHSLSLYASLPDVTASSKNKTETTRSRDEMEGTEKAATRRTPKVPMHIDFDSDEEYAMSLKQSLKDRKRQHRQKLDHQADNSPNDEQNFDARRSLNSLEKRDFHKFNVPNSPNTSVDHEDIRFEIHQSPEKKNESPSDGVNLGEMTSLHDSDLTFEFQTNDAQLNMDQFDGSKRPPSSTNLAYESKDNFQLQSEENDRWEALETDAAATVENDADHFEHLETVPKSSYTNAENYQNDENIHVSQEAVPDIIPMPLKICDDQSTSYEATPDDAHVFDSRSSNKTYPAREDVGGADGIAQGGGIKHVDDCDLQISQHETDMTPQSSDDTCQDKLSHELRGSSNERMDRQVSKESYLFYEEHIKKLPLMKNQSFEIKLLYQLLESPDDSPETEASIEKILSDTIQSDPLLEVENMFAMLGTHGNVGPSGKTEQTPPIVPKMDPSSSLKFDGQNKSLPLLRDEQKRDAVKSSTKQAAGSVGDKTEHVLDIDSSKNTEVSASNSCDILMAKPQHVNEVTSNSLPNPTTHIISKTLSARNMNSLPGEDLSSMTKKRANSPANRDKPNACYNPGNALSNGMESTNQKISPPVEVTVPPLPGIIFQPEDGNMTTLVDTRYKLAGYASSGTIMYKFDFKSGRMKHDGPFSRQQYLGTFFTTYLPINQEGNDVGELLKEAFEKRKLFTIAKSDDVHKDNIVIPSVPLITDKRKFPNVTYLEVLRRSLCRLLEKEK